MPSPVQQIAAPRNSPAFAEHPQSMPASRVPATNLHTRHTAKQSADARGGASNAAPDPHPGSKHRCRPQMDRITGNPASCPRMSPARIHAPPPITHTNAAHNPPTAPSAFGCRPTPIIYHHPRCVAAPTNTPFPTPPEGGGRQYCTRVVPAQRKRPDSSTTRIPIADAPHITREKTQHSMAARRITRSTTRPRATH